ncbi:MAG: VWA domain-containing protein [Oscillospiraceae bacterium]|nr:VWA domain-containing protein [Oscillospiraceae bacterium]
MGFDPAIRAKVRKLALDKKSKLTARDVLMSEELKSYLSSLAVSMGNGAGETTTIIVDDGGPDAPSGYTNGTRMYLNCTSHKLDYFDNLEGKFLGFMGTFFHEKAHDLFNDFNEFRNAMRYIDSGHFYGEKPRNMNAKQEADWTDMEDALQAPHTRQIFQTVFKDLDNIIADRHDEDSLIDAYGAFVGESLYLSRQAKQADADFFESEVHKVNTGEQDELVFMTNNMFQLCLFDEVLARSQKTVETSDYWQSIEKIQEHARIACATDDISRRFSEMNWMLLYFWPYIRNAIQKLQDQKNQQQGSSATQQNPNGSGSGNDQNQNTQGNQGSQLQSGQGGNNQQPTSSISADDVQQLLNALNKGTGNLGSNPAPQNHHSSDIAITRRANERNGKVPEKNQAGAKAATDAMSKQGKEAVYQALNSITSEIAQNQAEDELEGEASAVLVDAVTAVNDAGSHKGIKVNTDRVLGVTASDVNNYNMIMEELRPVSRRLQKQMLDALRDLKDGYVQRHKQFGRTIIPSDAYRPDQRFFANKKLPQDLPDMALSVLVDHSGSMGGNRIESAMKASLLLHDFCTGLNIPIAVAGHNAERGVCVNYYIYADYEQISNKDRYRAARMAAALTKMRANNCNRDGAALTISAKLLEKRQEEVRLLIIISDGRPNDEGYGGEEAAKDIQNIVKQCKQRGIEVLACAIGDDKENIAAIYGDSFIDITDLSKLPKTLVDIVKKRIINSAF